MSIPALNWAWERETTPAEKLVLLALADHANQERKCWPGRSRMCRMTGLSPRSVSRAIMSLSNKGLISVTRQRGAGSNYILTGDTVAPVVESDQGHSGTTPGSESPYPRDTVAPPLGSQWPPNRKDEPSTIRKKNHKAKSPSVAYPEWLDQELWSKWKAHLKEKRKPLKPTRETIQLEDLEKWKAQGHDPHEIIRKSIGSGWPGLYEPKTGSPHGRQSINDKNAEYFRKSEGTAISGDTPIKIINPSSVEDNESDLPN